LKGYNSGYIREFFVSFHKPVFSLICESVTYTVVLASPSLPVFLTSY